MGCAASSGGGEACFEMLLLAQLQVKLHLFIEVVLKLAALKEHPEAAKSFVKEHGATPFRQSG
jgi:hypothetical protein